MSLHRIAALDDSPEDLEILEDQLRSIPGWEVRLTGASTRAELDRILRDQTPDQFFNAHHLGWGIGLDVVKSRREAGVVVPLVALAGQDDHRVAARDILLGADEYLRQSDLTHNVHGSSIEGVPARRRLKAKKAALEEELSRARRLESLEALAAVIARDFDGLLGSVRRHLERASLHPMPEAPAGHLARAFRSCMDMMDMVRILLEYGPQQPAVKLPLDVAQLVRDSSEILRSILPEKVIIVTEVPLDGLIVAGDPTMMQIVVLNLARTGADSMPGGGQLNLSATRRGPSDRCGESIVIEVTDQGAGVPAERRDRIFESYSRERPDSSGPDLELALVWQAVHRHGGTVSLDSAPGRGSRFSVCLPAYRSPS